MVLTWDACGVWSCRGVLRSVLGSWMGGGAGILTDGTKRRGRKQGQERGSEEGPGLLAC